MDEILIGLARCKQPTCKARATLKPVALTPLLAPRSHAKSHSGGSLAASFLAAAFPGPAVGYRSCSVVSRHLASKPHNKNWLYCSLLQVLLGMSRKAWRAQTVDRLLFAPEEVPQECLERLHRCVSFCSVALRCRNLKGDACEPAAVRAGGGAPAVPRAPALVRPLLLRCTTKQRLWT